MSHANKNFKTKKELKEFVAGGGQMGVHNPSGLFPTIKDGTDVVEGPWEYHKWYAQVTLVNGIIKSVK